MTVVTQVRRRASVFPPRLLVSSAAREGRLTVTESCAKTGSQVLSHLQEDPLTVSGRPCDGCTSQSLLLTRSRASGVRGAVMITRREPFGGLLRLMHVTTDRGGGRPVNVRRRGCSSR